MNFISNGQTHARAHTQEILVATRYSHSPDTTSCSRLSGNAFQSERRIVFSLYCFFFLEDARKAKTWSESNFSKKIKNKDNGLTFSVSP